MNIDKNICECNGKLYCDLVRHQETTIHKNNLINKLRQENSDLCVSLKDLKERFEQLEKRVLQLEIK
jgi:hypothetical protein